MHLSVEEKEQFYPLLSPTSQTLLKLFEEAFAQKELCPWELLMRVSGELGGTYVYLPQEQKMKRRLRDINIKKSFESGVTANQLAKDHHLSIQKIYRVLNTQPSSGDE